MRFPSKQQRLRHRMINEWRNVDGGPVQDLPALPLSELIPQVLKSWKLDDRMKAEEMLTAWKDIVGDFVAQHTAPEGIKRQVLIIRLTQPAIHHTLMMRKADLLNRLQQRFGVKTIKDIRFQHG